MPVSGIARVMPPMLISAWKAIQQTMPVASSEPKSSRALQHDAEAAIDQHGEQDDDADRADEAQLLADDREDAVGVGARDVEELLPAGAEAQAADAAAAQRDQQLQRLEADAGRVVSAGR